MAVAFRSADKTTASGTSNVITKPAGTASGDVLILRVNWTTGTVSSVPSGFIEFTSGLGTDTGGQQRCYWKVAGGSEPATYTVNFSGSVPSDCDISAYTGADQTTPLGVGDAENTVNAGNSTATATGLSITASRNGSLLVHLAVSGPARTSGPAGTTNQLTYDTSVYVDTVPVGVGATGNKTSAFATTGSWIVHMVVIRPAGDPGLRLPDQQQAVGALWSSQLGPMQRRIGIAAIVVIAANGPPARSVQPFIANLWAQPVVAQQRSPLDAAILAPAVAQVDTVLRPQPRQLPQWPADTVPARRVSPVAAIAATAVPDLVLLGTKLQAIAERLWPDPSSAAQPRPAIAAVAAPAVDQVDTVLTPPVRQLGVLALWSPPPTAPQRSESAAAITADPPADTVLVTGARQFAALLQLWAAPPAPVQRAPAVAAIFDSVQIDTVLRAVPGWLSLWPADLPPVQRLPAVAAISAPQETVIRPATSAGYPSTWPPLPAPVQRVPAIAAVTAPAVDQVDTVLKPQQRASSWAADLPPAQRLPSVAAISATVQVDTVLRPPLIPPAWPPDPAPTQRGRLIAGAIAAPDTILQPARPQPSWLTPPPASRRAPAVAAIFDSVQIDTVLRPASSAASTWPLERAAVQRAPAVAAITSPLQADTVLRAPKGSLSLWPADGAPMQRRPAIAAVAAAAPLTADTVLCRAQQQGVIQALWLPGPSPVQRAPAAAAILAPVVTTFVPATTMAQRAAAALWISAPAAAARAPGVAALPGASVDTVLRPPSAIPSAWPSERVPAQRAAAVAAVFASQQIDTVLRTTSIQAQVAALWLPVPPAAPRSPSAAAITAPAVDTVLTPARQQEIVRALWSTGSAAAIRPTPVAAILAPPAPNTNLARVRQQYANQVSWHSPPVALRRVPFVAAIVPSGLSGWSVTIDLAAAPGGAATGMSLPECEPTSIVRPSSRTRMGNG